MKDYVLFVIVDSKNAYKIITIGTLKMMIYDDNVSRRTCDLI